MTNGNLLPFWSAGEAGSDVYFMFKVELPTGEEVRYIIAGEKLTAGSELEVILTIDENHPPR
jgi:hypothetical protein